MDKVRGGSYVNVELDDFQKQSINTEIWGAKDLCTQCGRAGHFVKDCYSEFFLNQFAYNVFLKMIVVENEIIEKVFGFLIYLIAVEKETILLNSFLIIVYNNKIIK
jgi:hypothetical protein